MLRPVLFTLTLFIAVISSGQQIAPEHCTAHSITQRFLQQQGLPTNIQEALPAMDSRGGGGGTLTVPVVVHVVWNTSAENVPTASIMNMIATLNEDFSQSNPDISGVRPAFTGSIGNPNIQFCLATTDPNGNPTTGIVRVQTTDTWFDPDTQTDDMKSAPLGSPAWDTENYLNIWICDITSGAGGSAITVGYAYLPVGGVVGTSIDGLVVDYDYGVNDRTATHEIGHYFGLDHPWGDGGCGSDDGFTDTPNTNEPTFSCANTSLMNCSVLTQYENFMDYSNCPVMYTTQQGSYMRSILQGVRSSLLSSPGCGGINPGAYCIPTALVGTSDGDFINSVELGSINNTNTGGTTAPPYTDYSGSETTQLTQGSSYTVTIESGTWAGDGQSPGDNFAVWIDFDQDQEFSAGEKLGEFQNTSPNESVGITFSVPIDAELGSTRMRVRGVFIEDGDPSPADPCYNYTWGETEDYGITILAGSGFCIPGSMNGTSDGDFINGVAIGSIDNQNTGDASGPTYVDYTSLSTTLLRGTEAMIIIESGAYEEDNFAAWIDYDQDELFEASEKLGEFATTTPYETDNITFTIPVSAELGETRLRVRGVYHLNGEPSPSEPCFSYVYGETEDYTIFIEQPTSIGSSSDENISIFPNPANDRITILLPTASAEVLIHDVQGRIILSSRGIGDRLEIETSSISAGSYFVQVNSGNVIHRLPLQIVH
jgi:hypothetical protein